MTGSAVPNGEWPGDAATTSRLEECISAAPLLQKALVAGATAAWHTDLTTHVRWWSDEMFRIHGAGDAAVARAVPSDYLNLVHPEDRAVVRAAFRELMEFGSHRVQYRVVWSDGTVHWIEGTGRSTANLSGEVESISGVCTLIDPRKQEELDLRFMAEATTEFARTTDYEETLRRVAAMAVPHFADWCAVDMLDAAGRLTRLAVAHVDPSKVELAVELHRRYPPDPDAHVGTWYVLKTAQPELVAEITDELLETSARDPEHLRIVRELGLRSYIGVPIVSSERVLGVITFVSSAESGRIYGERELHLTMDLVAKAAISIQNAELFHVLKRSELRQRFLLDVTDVLRRNCSTLEILCAVSEMLGRHFCVDRVGYGHVAEQKDLLDYDVCWTDGSVPPLLGRYPASAFGPQVIQRLQDGGTVAIPDVRHHELTNELSTIKTSHEVDTRAILVVPLSRAGQLRTIVYLNQRQAREWKDDEISLMEEVAERTRELIERGRTEAALRQSADRYQALFDSIDEGFCIVQMIFDAQDHPVDYRFLEVNPAFERQAGMPNPIGRTILEILPDIDRAYIETYAQVAISGKPIRFERHSKELDRWFDTFAFRIGESAQRRVALLFTDITERKRTEAALVESESQLREAQHLAGIGSWSWTAATDEYPSASPELLKIFGFPPGGRLPAFAQQKGTLYPTADWERLRAAVKAALSQGESYSLDLHAFRGAEPIWITTRGGPIKAEDGSVAGLRGTVQEITERKHVEEALRQADLRKDEFLATLAHELRNPLAPLRNGLEILKRTADANGQAVRAREVMERQLNVLVRLVDDLLDVSRVSQGKVVMKKTITSLQALVDQALEASRPLIEAAGHTLQCAIPREPLLLHVDPTRMAQVLSNLLNNAAKYTPRGGVITLAADVAQPSRLRIAIRDNGVGIPPHMLDEIFQLFTQVGSATAHSQGGLGIGLSLARRLVELHDGAIWAESLGEGEGSTFVVEIPFLALNEDAVAPEHSGAQAGAAGRLSVLVVDDNIDAADSLAMLLELDGHRVEVTHSGACAIEAASGNAPDVIFLDIGLPDIAGYDVAAKLRALPSLGATRLVALTGWASEQERQRARSAGIDLYLTKPVTLADLAEVLGPLQDE